MYTFLNFFVAELASGKNVKYCIENAKNEAFEDILHQLKLEYDVAYVRGASPNF